MDYNILHGWSYMYEMTTVTSSVFRVNMLPHERKFVTVDQVMYCEKKTLITPNGILPHIGSSLDFITKYIEFGPRQIKPSILLNIYPGEPPLLLEDVTTTTGAYMCMMSSLNTQ